MPRGELALADDTACLCREREDPADPACAPVLELLVSIYLAREDLDAAAEAVDGLAQTRATK